jgi:hypothetical protein
MSRTSVLSVGVLGALGLALASSSFAAGKAVGAGCGNVTFNADFLKAYPRAPAACQEVVTKDGRKVVRFTAQVSKVTKDHFQLVFLNAVGKPLEPAQTLTLIPQAGQKVTVNGKQIAYADLRKGDKLDFWVPENDVGAYLDPSSTALHTIVLP